MKKYKIEKDLMDLYKQVIKNFEESMAVSKQKRPRVLAIDLGYSSVKISFIDDNGSLVNYKMISAIFRTPRGTT